MGGSDIALIAYRCSLHIGLLGLSIVESVVVMICKTKLSSASTWRLKLQVPSLHVGSDHSDSLGNNIVPQKDAARRSWLQ